MDNARPRGEREANYRHRPGRATWAPPPERRLPVTNRFNVVAVRIKDERAVVIFVIVRAQPRLPVVSPPGCERGLEELIHGFPVLGDEGDVAAGLRSLSQADPEECLPFRAVAGGGLTFGIQALDPERTKRLIVKSN